jgi:hypothetical protein
MNSRRRVDTSPKAIDRRLRDLSELHELGLSLGKARRLGTLKEVRGATAPGAADGSGAGMVPETLAEDHEVDGRDQQP